MSPRSSGRRASALRLVAALEAGQAAGGDKRGKQCAAMLIVKKCGGVWLHNDVVLRLQVDDSPEPIVELRRLGGEGAAAAARRHERGERSGLSLTSQNTQWRTVPR